MHLYYVLFLIIFSVKYIDVCEARIGHQMLPLCNKEFGVSQKDLTSTQMHRKHFMVIYLVNFDLLTYF